MYKLFSVNHTPKTLYMALLYSISVSSFRALEQVQPALLAEITGYYNFIGSHHVSSFSQSYSLAAVFNDNVIMQVLDVNSSVLKLLKVC